MCFTSLLLPEIGIKKTQDIPLPYRDAEKDEVMSCVRVVAEWGINEIYRMQELGTLDFTKIGSKKEN